MARAPRDHSVFFQPFENALTSGEAALPKDAALRPMQGRVVGSPSVLTLASTTLDNTYAIPKRSKALARDRPLKFACKLGKVCWRVFQGSDPLLTASAHGFVARQLQPHVVVRLNEWSKKIPDIGIRTYTTYGARCEHVITVPDLVPDHLRQTDASGTREHALALMLHELFELLLSLLTAFPEHIPSDEAPVEHSRSTSGEDDGSEGSSSASGSEDDEVRSARRQRRRTHGERLPRVVYIHCAAGRERSRFVTIALHAALYVLNMRARAKERLDVQSALRSWADRQACFPNNQLSIRTLLTHNPDDMFPILARTIGRLAGISVRADLESVVETLRRAEQGTTRRGNYHNICAAGADCPQRSDPLVEFFCSYCHSAFFCSLDCIIRCSHAEKCPNYFNTSLDTPMLLQASAMEQHATFSQSRRARAISESSKIGKAVPALDASD